MKKLFFIVSIGAMMAACNTKTDPDPGTARSDAKDTLTYTFKATYSSDITVPSNPVIAQRVLQIWKMFETNQIQTHSEQPYLCNMTRSLRDKLVFQLESRALVPTLNDE